MTKQVVLSVKDRKFIKAKLEGKSNTQAAMEATGAKSKDVAKTQGHRLSTNVNIQSVIQQELAKLDITPSKVIKVYAEAMQAVKVVIVGKDEDAFADVQPDHNTRMRAAEKLGDLLGMKVKLEDAPQLPTQLPPEVLASGDEIELQRAIFRRNT